jgi:hypothetical protein
MARPPDEGAPPDLAPQIVGDPDLGPDLGCSMQGDWTIYSTDRGASGGLARFTASQIIVWGPGLGPPTSDPVGVAEYHLAYGAGADPLIVLDSSTGLSCDESATFRFSYGYECFSLFLTAETDNCTGARDYLDGEVRLQR